MARNIGVILSLKDKCSPQLQKIADKMGITVEQAKKIDRQIQKTAKQMQAGFRTAAAAAAAAAGAVAAGCGLLINQTMEAGDRVDKMSQKIGLSRKAFQQWDYIMSQSGSNIDKMQVGMKTLAQQMVNSTKKGSEAEKIFKRLGVSVKNSHGQFINQEEAFEQIIIAFQKMPDGIEKANMAQKLFGKTGSDLRPLLNGVRGNVVELKKKYEELGLGMSDDAVNAAVKLTDTMDTVKRALGAVGWSIGAELLPVVQEMTDKFIKNLPQIKTAVMPVITNIIDVFKFLTFHIKGITITAGIMFGVFAACKVINTAANAFNTLANIINLCKAAGGLWNFVLASSTTLQIVHTAAVKTAAIVQTAWTAGTKAMAAAQNVLNIALNNNPIGRVVMIVTGAILAIAALTKGIIWLVQNWDKVTEAVQKAINAIKSFINLKIGKKKVEVETVNNTVEKSEKPKKHALGTTYSTGGAALVGEYGPELINLKRGDTVTPADRTRQILTNNKPVTVNVNIAGNLIGNNEFIQSLKNMLALELKTALAAV